MQDETTKKTCDQVINLGAPKRGNWEGRGFDRRYVWVYVCPKCGNEVRVRAGAFRGRTPVPGAGGIYCGRPVTGGDANVDN